MLTTKQVTYFETLTATSCGGCGINFAMPDTMLKRRREDHRDFWCPNGHKLAFNGPSPSEQAKREAEQKLALAERELANKDEVLRSERASHSVTKGKLTKERNRAAKGVCPVQGCKRSFVNVARHVAGQHPEHLALMHS